MLVKLKRGLRRVEKSLARPFRGLGRKPVIYLDHMDWDGPRALTAALKQNASAFEPLTAVVTTLSACIEAFDDRARARKEYEPLRTDLNDLFRGLSNYLSDETAPSETTKRRMVNLARGIDTEAGLLARGVEQNEVERGVRDLDEVFRGYRRVRALLARFTLNEITKLWKIPGERDPDTHLDRLPNPAAAWYDSVVPDNPRRNGCTPNTRVELLKQLGNWTSYSLDRRLYWLSGATGTGKTTIAYSLCEQLECSGKLAASFFCARWSPECRDAHIILPSISHQLSSFSRPFRYAIFGTINQGVDAQALPIDRQFELLIAAPLRMIGHTLPSGITIVIDALDECEDEDGVDQILSALLAHVSELPVKFFITSRPEHKIANRMQSEREDSTLLESLDDIDPSTVRGDIKTYMGAELATANPSSENLEQLCELSGTLFEYAAIFVRYVMRGYLYGGTERMQRMQRLLRIPTSLADEGDERMDPAYSAFLEAALEVDAVGGPERAEINRVLHTVICAPEPLTAGILAGLLGTSVTRLTHYPLQALRPVLQVSSTGLVNPRHTSFRDYLLDQKRSGKLYCDAKQHNVRLVHSCLDLIRVPWHPHNGYDLDSSYLYDRENCGENESVNTAVLLHACRHWVAHLELVERSIASAAARRLNQELNASTTSEMDAFFRILLQAVFENGALQDSNGNRVILSLRTLIYAQEPLTVNAMASLLALNSNMVHSLTPVLVVSSTTGIVTVLHDSLSAFLLDQKRSGKFHCDAGQHNEWLAQRCFDTIKVPNPPFNICNLPTSYLLDREVSDLKERVEKAISPVLLYACRYWGAHLILASPEEGLLNALYELLSTRLLLWMEILNLNQRIDEGAMTFYKLSQWIQSIKCPDAIRQLILDARIFVAAFSLSPMSDSTPHIYVSLLPFWPEYKPISTRYLKRMPGVVKVNRSTSRKRPGNAVLISKLRASSISILCVACSPDGAYIVSGSSDKTIRIWDAHTGQPVTPPLVGHAGSVYSVAYSPDGSYLVSGSDDKTIRIWNAQTGQPVGQPLSGHTASVDSVAYSPDGAYIVSGSSDDTIRIWNAQSGQSVGQPLMGHTDSVSSVAYSPDSAYVVSGSSDRTIRIWDTHTGQPVGQPLTGHTSLVLSVAYSPNGAYIVSGSDDRTIRIWDTHTWQPRGQPLTGHNELVWSVACSPDDAYIVSADDMIIRIWDAHTGQPVGQPLTGHTDSVYSVAYSPDGAYIVSGSDDGDIYIWATDLEEPIGSRPDSSSQLAQSAIHSPDHSRIISSPAQNDSSASKTATDSTPEQRSEPKGATPLHDGTLNEDGWVVNTNNDRLLWVPPFARSSPQIPRKPVATPAVHQITLDFQDAKFGDEWMHCFDATCVD